MNTGSEFLMRSEQTTLDHWTDVCRQLFGKQTHENAVHPVHSCIIGGIQQYIHSPSLPKEDPKFYSHLLNFAKKHKIKLKACQRTHQKTQQHCRRRALLPILFLAFNVNAEAIFTDTNKVSLNLLSKETKNSEEIYKQDEIYTDNFHKININAALFNETEKTLNAHFVAQENDPESIRSDIKQLAEYFSQFPEAQKLLRSIAHLKWELKYAPYTFQTDITGSQFNIKSVTVYFDPRSGAKLKFYDRCDSKKPFCVASPADALLHELLHVQSILNDTENFIADGGLSQHVYPITHERKTILKENVLYKSMSLRDNKPRPIRNEHSGRHVLVACVTCID